MNFGEAIASGFSNYFNFSSRTPRSGFWYWALFAFIVGVISNGLDMVLFGPSDSGLTPISGVTSLALFIPGLSVLVRRLHDIDRTGWWFLISFTIIGLFVLIYWACVKGTPGPNRFGPDPLGGSMPVSMPPRRM